MKQKQVLIGIGVIVVLLIGMAAWVFMARPSQAEIDLAIRPLPPLPINSLNEAAFQSVSKREVNGDLPVTPANPEPVRENPFTP